MNKTIEDLNREYENREEDENWFNQQAVLSSEEDAARACDEDGNFHCIKWFDCQHCPAFNSNYCL